MEKDPLIEEKTPSPAVVHAAALIDLVDEGAIRLQGATITLSIFEGNEVVYIGARKPKSRWSQPYCE